MWKDSPGFSALLVVLFYPVQLLRVIIIISINRKMLIYYLFFVIWLYVSIMLVTLYVFVIPKTVFVRLRKARDYLSALGSLFKMKSKFYSRPRLLS